MAAALGIRLLVCMALAGTALGGVDVPAGAGLRAALPVTPPSAQAPHYSVAVTDRGAEPVLSWADGSSAFRQTFNPTFVRPSQATGGRAGLLVRAQQCEYTPGRCVFCAGPDEKASVLAFAERRADLGFEKPTGATVVFGPHDGTDRYGTEDPRMEYDESSGEYVLFYTAWDGTDAYLSVATTRDPTAPGGWTRHGRVFPSKPGSKSAALIVRTKGPHYLLWGDDEIRVATSNSTVAWPDPGRVLITTRADHFDSQLVESGPPPLLLSTGDYLFLYNSASTGWPKDPAAAYHVGWLILSGHDPAVVLQRSAEPLMAPVADWERGSPDCNAPNVVFVEAAEALGGDRFRVYYGGADAAIGTAVLTVSVQ